MTDNIFNGQPSAATTTDAPAPTAPQPQADDSLLKEIVNEQGVPKYSTVTDALKALQASQEHIRRIEQENASLRETAIKVKTTEELLATLKPKTEDVTTKPVEIESVVEKVLKQREQQSKEVENLNEVITTITQLFGEEKASQVFYDKAQEVGLSREEINKLAAKSPKLVIKLFTDKAQPKPSPSNLPGIRPEALKDKPTVPVKSGMSLGSTADLLASWRQAGDKAKQSNQG
jgi:hypothetical protein